MAVSNFSIQLSFEGATQAAADAKRDAALIDYARSMNLDIYSDPARTIIDPAKVGPAVRQSIKDFVKSRIVRQRADAARAAAAGAEESSIGVL